MINDGISAHFHRNVAWYCCEYHERNTINLSLFIQQMIQNSRPLFQAFQPCNFTDMLQNICTFHLSSACYAYLPAPAFLTARESLLRPWYWRNVCQKFRR